ncbi:MAG: nucleoside hydrolase [Caryophanon sp.]|nr:nucleoside hydrolase [Caryophanon sp.]
MNKKPVIIDTDPGIDDAMMLIYAFASDALDVKLVTTEAGNLSQAKTSYNAQALLSYLQVDVEIAKGLEHPILRPLEVAEDIHGETGFGTITFPAPTLPLSERGAVEAMRQVLLASDEPMTIIATGPLTNVAALLLAHPEVKPHIAHISWMGGSAVGGNMSPTAEFNAYVDPHAAEIVFRSGVRITMSGLDVTHKAYVTLPEVARIRAIGTPFAQRVEQMLTFYLANMHETPFHTPNYSTTLRFHDLCAVIAVTHPHVFSGMDCYVSVVVDGQAAGTTHVDYMGRTGLLPNAHVLHTVDRDAFVDLFVDAVTRMNERVQDA